MNEQNQTQAQTPELSAEIMVACEIAVTDADPPDTPREIRSGHKDLNCKGRGPWWYRMVWRNGAWKYLSNERLPSGTLRAADRRATTYAEAWPGEIVIQHERGGPIDTAYLVVGEAKKPLQECELGRTRDGQLRITLPDGRQICRPNPRRS